MDTTGIKKEPLYWIDLIRTVAIFLVIVIHVATPVFNEWAHLPASWRTFANIYGSIARMSVPLFFMASGFLLLPRSESIGDFFAKRVNKVLLPFVVWSIFYLFWGCVINHNACEGNALSRLILVHGTYYHLWFIY